MGNWAEIAMWMTVVVALGLWLFERVPSFVPTLLLLCAGPLFLEHRGVTLAIALQAMAQPVLALFFGGFVLAAAVTAHGVDHGLVALVLRVTRGDKRALVVGLTLLSAFLSMWMSNVAAAALLVHVVRPLVAQDPRFARAVLLGVAFGANVGGIATPIGTGPNGIAIALSPTAVSFAQWMAFALPLTLLLLAVVIVVVVVGFGVAGRIDVADADVANNAGDDGKRRAVLALYGLTVALWLTGPLHGVDAAVVAVGAAAAAFLFGLLNKSHFASLDWATLALVGGGLLMGELLERGGALAVVDDAVRAAVDVAGVRVGLAVVVVVAALLSALMSNTATATLLIPLALAIDPSAGTAALVAVGCSLGAPFVVSTPPNALVAGAGVTSGDLMKVGIVVLVVGLVVVVVTGPAALALFLTTA
jgi:sodium-dependent dicarboxylate transporter 2/3/5